jgi:hypothetical protein
MKQYIVSEENSSFERAEKEVLFFIPFHPSWCFLWVYPP